MITNIENTFVSIMSSVTISVEPSSTASPSLKVFSSNIFRFLSEENLSVILPQSRNT